MEKAKLISLRISDDEYKKLELLAKMIESTRPLGSSKVTRTEVITILIHLGEQLLKTKAE